MSGLAAAKKLLTKRCNLIVLEARNRIGGRIWTDHTSFGVPIDKGASWIHGIEGNPLTPIATRAKSRLFVDKSSMVFPRPHAPALSVDIGDKITDQFWDMYDQAAEYSEAHNKDIQKTDTIEGFFEKRMQELKGSGNWTLEEIDQLHAMCYFAENYEAADLDKLSLKFASAEATFEGEHVYLGGGYYKLLKEYAGDVINSGVIKLGEAVKKIQYTDSLAKVTTNTSTYVANAVIVTLPLGVLKHDDVQFRPPLPHSKKTSHNKPWIWCT